MTILKRAMTTWILIQMMMMNKADLVQEHGEFSEKKKVVERQGLKDFDDEEMIDEYGEEYGEEDDYDFDDDL